MIRFIAPFLLMLLSACESNPPAPVIDRIPQASKAGSADAKKPTDSQSPDAKSAASSDWRPDSHIVKKGDTLFGIGLEYGLDYKEIAAANNITEPYPIKIGQKIDLTSFKSTASPTIGTNQSELESESDKTEANNTENGVVVTPVTTEPVVGEKTVAETKPLTSPAASVVTPVLTEPTAVREPYSLEALNRQPAKSPEVKPIETKTAEAKPTEAKPIDPKPADTKVGDESIAWTWPTQGKVVAGFNETSNKGINISGSTGQAINAAGNGKVIYSGSDLRGYGKLVIVKHNKTYLSVYAHNSKIVVKEGQTVTAGQKIAEMGNTDSNSVKLHFEIRRLGKSVDPAKYLTQN